MPTPVMSYQNRRRPQWQTFMLFAAAFSNVIRVFRSIPPSVHCDGGMACFREPARLILEFERNVELGTVGFDLSFGIQLQIEFHDFRDTKFAQGFSGPVDRGLGRLLPGILAGTDQFNDFVDALRHVVLPFGILAGRRVLLPPTRLTSGPRLRKAQSRASGGLSLPKNRLCGRGRRRLKDSLNPSP